MTGRCFVLCLAVAGIALGAQSVADSYIVGAWSGQTLAVKSALESGRVDVDLRTPDGDTALMLASLAGHERVVSLLLQAGADPALSNENGETPLILAAKYGFTDIARSLLEAGADVNALDRSARSAWTWASWGDNTELAGLLEAAGADTTVTSDPFRGDGGAPVDRFQKVPELTKTRVPKMPKALKGQPLDGTITLSVVVRRDGTPGQVEILEGLDEALDRAAIEAVQKWRFEPGRVQDQPVDGVVNATLRYLPALGDEPKFGIHWKRWRY